MQLMFKDTTLLVLVGSFIIDTVQDMMSQYLRITPIQKETRSINAYDARN